MANLSAEAISAWLDKLPDDVREAVGDDSPAGDEGRVLEISGILEEAESGDIAGIVAERADDFVAMGRARRLRFLAWVSRRTYPESGLLFRRLTEESFIEDSEGETGVGAGKVAPYFLEDVKALVRALGPRVARQVVNGDNLSAVVRSSYEVQGEAEFRQGGAM